MRTVHLVSALSFMGLGWLLTGSSGCGNSSAGPSGSNSSFDAGGNSSSSSGAGSSSGSGSVCMGGLVTCANMGDDGGPIAGSGGAQCEAGTGKACVQGKCAMGACCTTISGAVYDPAGQNPLYNVNVYANATAVAPLPDGASCVSCDDLYSGDPLATALTDTKGHFSIQDAPSGSTVSLVIQIGKWRKLYTMHNVQPCVDNPVPDKLTLPKNQSEGNIPNIAISTGNADSLECLLRRIGIDSTEYTGDPVGMGRIKIFYGYNGATVNGPSAQSSQQLWDTKADLMRYDVVLLSCQGRETADGGGGTVPATNITSQDQQALFDYANSGGRVFASHYHYAWLNSGPFAGAVNPPFATWMTGAAIIADPGPYNASFITTLASGSGMFPEGVALHDWLNNVGALTNDLLPIYYARHNVLTTAAPAQQWLALDKSSPTPNAPQYFSIDMPLMAPIESRCGRVVYSDLHVSGGPGTGVAGYAPDYPNQGILNTPDGCADHPLSPQEKALEFMLFDLTSCITPPGMMMMPIVPK